MARHIQLYAGEETPGQSVTVVAQLCGIDSAGCLGVDDGGALEPLGTVARLKLQLCHVVAPGAVGHSHDGLPAVFKALAPWLQGNILDEVAV